jgi:hypothetical protein
MSMFDNYNTFLETAMQKIMCDSDCQKNKQEDNLKEQYLKAQTNLVTAPQQLKEAQKEYIINVKGQSAYNSFEDQQINKNADNIIILFNETFENESKEITTKIKTYNNILINLNNIVDLYIQYKKENKELFEELKDTTNDIVTNDRKTYYEDQGIDYLKFIYYYIFLIIYVIVIIIYCVISFVFPSHISFKIRIGIFIGLCLLPFIMTSVICVILALFSLIIGVLPKNVYL